MNDNPTLREAAQAFQAWLTAHYQAAMAWLSSLGDIHIHTIGTVFLTVFLIGTSALFALGGLAWLARLRKLTGHYRGLGHTRLHALRLAQADITDEGTKYHRAQNRSYKGQPTWFSATPAERETWAQDLEQKRH